MYKIFFLGGGASAPKPLLLDAPLMLKICHKLDFYLIDFNYSIMTKRNIYRNLKLSLYIKDTLKHT